MSGTPQPTSQRREGVAAEDYAALAARESAYELEAIAMGDDYAAAAHRQFAETAWRLALENA
jgi:hypothetical protein